MPYKLYLIFNGTVVIVCKYSIPTKIGKTMAFKIFLRTIIFVLFAVPASFSDTRYVAKSGRDSGICTNSEKPCLTIGYCLKKMSAGDTLNVGDGIYSESINGKDIPSGTKDAYTTIMAKNVHGVTLIGSISISNSYIQLDGFRINGNGADTVIGVYATDHVKVMRVAAFGAAATGNVSVFGVTQSSFVLFEECWAWGTGRYKFAAYWCDHAIFRRCVSRHDYHNDSLQCANFNNYDSVDTLWQNNIAIDSETANCTGGLYGGFFFENKTDHADDTSQTMNGNFIINVTNSHYSAGFLDRISGRHIISNMVIWGGESGYAGEKAPGNQTEPDAILSNWTVGGLSGNYNGRNGKPAGGTGVQFSSDFSNSVKNSIFYSNNSYGIADYVTSDYNLFYKNKEGMNGGDDKTPSIGKHSLTQINPRLYGLKYIPRIEAGSKLKTAGENGQQIGAEVMYKVGKSGTLFGEIGYNTLTSEPLWPFPNESLIKDDMASYDGMGGSGKRGFCTAGKQLNGKDNVTLTSYIWEYIGNPMPSVIY